MEHGHLIRCQQRDHQIGPPDGKGGNVQIKIALPICPENGAAAFSGGKGQTDLALGDLDRINSKRVG